MLPRVVIGAGSLYEVQGKKIMEKKKTLRNNKYLKVPCVENWRLKNRRKVLFSRHAFTDTLEERISIKETYRKWGTLNCAENLDVYKPHCNKQALALILGVMHLRGPFQTLCLLFLTSLFFCLFLSPAFITSQ